MNGIRFMVLVGVFGIFSVTALAQKVVTEGSGSTIKIIIDASHIRHTTTPKARETKAKDSPMSATRPTNDYTDIASEVSNAQVYKKFEVSKIENSSSRGTNWFNAISLCQGLNYNGSSGWRLPTYRELMLIYVLKRELEAVTGFNKFEAVRYWSATDFNGTQRYYLDFTNGTVDLSGYGNSSSWHRVRCVRDL